ncbi:hypothetical protein CEXT_353391 [Caerostris extrusa]|uniref:Uncharacterized protein n=1 Tax=Caerostris extrusa TaxID=172846 RepID=A0AAV4YD84_CAEEX|nr:hypothetical protein CEXT_353391 [Caerostris extrusa]
MGPQGGSTPADGELLRPFIKGMGYFTASGFGKVSPQCIKRLVPGALEGGEGQINQPNPDLCVTGDCICSFRQLFPKKTLPLPFLGE